MTLIPDAPASTRVPHCALRHDPLRHAAPRYWVVVASQDHVQAGVVGGFMQACHGKAAPLRRTRPGDGVVCYSPRISFGGRRARGGARGAGAAEARCQAFTALGYVADLPAYQADTCGGFTPWRRATRFRPVVPAPIAPLIPSLSFIRDPARWGAPFRFGFFEIPAADFAVIARALGVDASAVDPSATEDRPESVR